MQIELEHPADTDSSSAGTPALAVAPSQQRKPFWPALLTTAILLAPLAALGIVIVQTLDGGFALVNVILAVAFYVVVAHGLSIGFHRLFTHRSFQASRPLKIALAIIGSMSLQGSLIGWVADHRRHHMFSDHEGDPHSPVRPSSQRWGRLRGAFHAHLGWFYDQETPDREKYAPDLLADRDLVLVDRLFVPISVLTFVLPGALGYAITGRLSGAVAAFLWAGLLRVGLWHHVTWGTNSLCHLFGGRPFQSKDAARNVAPLAVISMGESFHNAHHAFPSMARYGVDRFQLDSTAACIRVFEKLGWATRVRWPNAARLDAARIAAPVTANA
jgi:stearoyl-CoA desaturase (delta-9 desaturase)